MVVRFLFRYRLRPEYSEIIIKFVLLFEQRGLYQIFSVIYKVSIKYLNGNHGLICLSGGLLSGSVSIYFHFIIYILYIHAIIIEVRRNI